MVNRTAEIKALEERVDPSEPIKITQFMFGYVHGNEGLHSEETVRLDDELPRYMRGKYVRMCSTCEGLIENGTDEPKHLSEYLVGYIYGKHKGNITHGIDKTCYELFVKERREEKKS